MVINYPWHWTEESHDRWSKHRARGWSCFIFVTGVLFWGGSMFIAMSVVPVIMRHTKPAGTYWLHMGIVWACAGLFWGTATWLASEWLYQRQLRSIERSKADVR